MCRLLHSPLYLHPCVLALEEPLLSDAYRDLRSKRRIKLSQYNKEHSLYEGNNCSVLWRARSMCHSWLGKTMGERYVGSKVVWKSLKTLTQISLDNIWHLLSPSLRARITPNLNYLPEKKFFLHQGKLQLLMVLKVPRHRVMAFPEQYPR